MENPINPWGSSVSEDKLKEIISVQVIHNIISNENSGMEVFFRGEAKNYSNTRLLPSVFRGTDEKKAYYDALTNFPQEFADLSNLSKLAKMQHYDYPTRLLDLTTNPLVALWFACSDYSRYRKSVRQDEREDGYFFVVKTKVENILTCDSDRALLLSCLSKLDDEKEKLELLKILQDAIDNQNKNSDFRINEKYIGEKSKDKLKYGALVFEKLIGEATRERVAFSKHRTNPKDFFSTFIVRPMVENERQRKQEGLFAIFGMQHNSINNSDEYTITRYIVPENSKDAIISQLDKFGINEATLFGDLESRASHNRLKEEMLTSKKPK